MTESFIVGLIVVVAFAWVAWTILLPAGLRNRLRRLAGRPVPSQPGGGCGGCCGCEAAGPKRGRHC
ncbi:hypothetical protein J2848_003548 [Azospirillum lipoferum]|uniref:FeoB-associated Cys-rich membrane protein n=1 Tax=Azospirillum lipoferum TaxID=193 RepID=A0A5A9GLG6_AZOLI|nr:MULTISPECIES: hypothetical protein [Azospirillum]KAA0595251.1 hypothetical protein FZ942_16580 [Azospirillum lipoferum]MCP1611870.1 hypothetical protein [Azospirillum lipoferum]MDW5533371.1 hypothetical protein [Azospirillum sp. NL1]